jgi:hypothetical protein
LELRAMSRDLSDRAAHPMLARTGRNWRRP